MPLQEENANTYHLVGVVMGCRTYIVSVSTGKSTYKINFLLYKCTLLSYVYLHNDLPIERSSLQSKRIKADPCHFRKNMQTPITWLKGWWGAACIVSVSTGKSTYKINFCWKEVPYYPKSTYTMTSPSNRSSLQSKYIKPYPCHLRKKMQTPINWSEGWWGATYTVSVSMGAGFASPATQCLPS
jgi:hypothetical protein